MHRSAPRIGRLALVSTLGALVLVVHGCAGKELPKTYPASGKVVRLDGQPLPGGTVYFRSTADPSLVAVGNLAADGSFSLSTIVGSEKVSGATAGEHQVTVMPTSTDRSQRAIVVAEKYVVKAEGENTFLIQVDPPTPNP